MYLTYLEKLQKHLEVVMKEDQQSIQEASVKVAESIQQDGIIHLFGCGHSHLLVEEVFFRAGGLAAVNPILIEPLMLHEGAVRSSQLERRGDIAKEFMNEQDIRIGDVVIVVSTSGKNPVPIDVAISSKEKGAFVIGLTSLPYSMSQASKHHTGKRLYEVCDLTLNNHAITGDAIMTHDKVRVPFGPTSTVIGTAIINAIFVEAIKHIANSGQEPPVFLSGNIEGADEHNQKLIEKYAKRIPLLS